MRLLFLTSRFPFPPHRGDRARVFNFIRQLSASHDIDLISFISSREEREYVGQLLRYCRAVHTVPHPPVKSILAVGRNAWRDIPLQVSYYRSGAMRKEIDETLKGSSYEAAYVHLFRMAPYAEQLGPLYRILDLTDAISREITHSLPYRKRVTRLLYTLERSRIERYEQAVVQNFDEVWFISERDRQAVSGSGRRSNMQVVPIGVDPDQFFPTSSAVDPHELLFVGNMSVLHNIDAVRYFIHDVLPLVLARLPGVRLTVVGADPVRSVTALSSPNVAVRGFVSDLNAALNEAAVFVAPLRFAAGVQTKVLEAMAAGRPVVTTSIVNDGLGAVPGRDILVADDAVAFADHIVNLCRDAEERRRLGAAARQFVKQTYRWSAVVDRMNDVRAALSSAEE